MWQPTLVEPTADIIKYNVNPDAPGSGFGKIPAGIPPEVQKKVANGAIPGLSGATRISGAHAWRSSITPIDQLLCQAIQV